MKMDGIIRASASAGTGAEENFRQRLVRLLWPYRFFLAIVILPTFLVASYYYLVASDQYESGADFVVRRSDSGGGSSAGLGQIFGFKLGSSQSQEDAFILQDYLLSNDTVGRLRAEDDLVGRFRRPGVDFISRLWFSNPHPETLLAYYRKHVTVTQDAETGITHLRVHAFSPVDAHHISRKLLLMGEKRINALNERSFRGQVASSKRDLADAETALVDIQHRLTGYRRGQNDIDPTGTGQAQISLVTTLTGSLVAARSRLNGMDGLVSRSSPQYRALASQVRALEAQIAGQSSRLAGQNSSIATSLGGYEDLVIRREFAAKRYAAAAASYEQARSDAMKQQLYLTRVVDANLPVKSLFPERGRIVLTVFFSLLMAYAIGWLLVAGVKEHSL